MQRKVGKFYTPITTLTYHYWKDEVSKCGFLWATTKVGLYLCKGVAFTANLSQHRAFIPSHAPPERLSLPLLAKRSGNFYNLLEKLWCQNQNKFTDTLLFSVTVTQKRTLWACYPWQSPTTVRTLWVFTQREVWRENTDEHCLPSTAWNICLLRLWVEF